MPAQPLLPLWVKLAFTCYLAILVPIYWRDYGPSNFLYFCDTALFLTLGALWLENAVLASMALVGILVPQLLWMVDFLCEAVGLHFTGLTGYMFNPEYRFFTRFLSFFHFWLPIFLVWLVWRLGYDGRAFVAWTLLAWVLLGVCYLWMAPPTPNHPPNQPVNINYVHGFSDQHPQTWMDPDWYFAALMVALPLAIYWPTHLVLGWLFTKPEQPV